MSIVTVVRNRPEPLADTIRCVRAQTYRHIEHVVVDGASNDGTVDVIRRHENGITRWMSEPDNGVYDAIDKGIRLSRGDYVCILHAGDLYEPDFVERALARAAAAPPDSVIFAGYNHGEAPVKPDEMSEGVFLHHLGINHSTFLVPRAVYDRIGLYDVGLRIVSDAIWTRRALDAGVRFVRLDGRPLRFAPGGLSAAKTPEDRAKIIQEWVDSYRLFFPFLSESAAEAVYLYRFDEGEGQRIGAYLESLDAADVRHPTWPRFLRALRLALEHIWRSRPLNAAPSDADGEAAARRLELAARLDIDLGLANVRAGAVELSTLLERLDRIKSDLETRRPGEPVTLHYLEVFSRPSETFIPDLIASMAAADGEAHVILCDRRIREWERPFDPLLAFDPAGLPSIFVRRVTEIVLSRLGPTRFVFHFAVNGWRLLDRIGVEWRRVPAVYMTHGIEVFDLHRPSPYRDFIVNVVAFLPQSRFTAVSNFLRDTLIDAGVPAEKVTLVHNAVHTRFHEHRTPGMAKRSVRERSGWAARIVNIGRLIPWKGHDVLLRALGGLKARGVPLSLTIVYGGEASRLDAARVIAEAEGVSGDVHFVESVDFDKTPNFFDEFDLFVSASTYTSQQPPRSETFGLAALEAIAAGLPVVATTAGGQPEVLGGDGPYARLVPPDDPDAMAEAILDLIRSGALDGDNADYAAERLARFSRDAQLASLERISRELRAPRLRAALFVATTAGGAGSAALNVHKSLLRVGIDSTLLQRDPGPSEAREPALRGVGQGRWIEDAHQPGDGFLREGHTIFSIDTDGLPPARLEEIMQAADVLNLHWHARFLSNDNVAAMTRAGVPVVFTVRDMHPLTGGCHFFHGCDGFTRDCYPCPQFLPEAIDLPRRVLAWKRANWDMRDVVVVALSEHSREILSRSSLFGTSRIEVIPNPVDVEVFKPTPKGEARAAFGIPETKTVVAYLPSSRSRVKGAAELARALQILERRVPAKDVVLLMGGRATSFPHCGFESVQVGHIAERDRLARFYSAADMTLVPSLEETFSNTVAESIACGTPVAGFRTGAIADLARDGRGVAAPVGDVQALAAAAETVLAQGTDPAALHAHVRATMTPEIVGRRYRDLFEELVAARADRKASEAAPTPAAPDPAEARTRYLAARGGRVKRSALSVTPVARALARSGRAPGASVVEDLSIFAGGWHHLEGPSPEKRWRWSQGRATLSIPNGYDETAFLLLDAYRTFQARTGQVELWVGRTRLPLTVIAGGPNDLWQTRYVARVPAAELAGRSRIEATLICRGAGSPAKIWNTSRDSRELGLCVCGLALTPVAGVEDPLRVAAPAPTEPDGRLFGEREAAAQSEGADPPEASATPQVGLDRTPPSRLARAGDSVNVLNDLSWWPDTMLTNGFLSVRPREAGHAFYGPYLADLGAGRYRVVMSVAVGSRTRTRATLGLDRAVFELVWNADDVLARADLDLGGLLRRRREIVLDVEITRAHAQAADAGLECRLWTSGRVALDVKALVVTRLDG